MLPLASLLLVTIIVLLIVGYFVLLPRLASGKLSDRSENKLRKELRAIAYEINTTQTYLNPDTFRTELELLKSQLIKLADQD